MYFELNCSCTAFIVVDVRQGKEEAAWLLINRFTSAHTACGFVTPLPDETPEHTNTLNIHISSPEQDS